MSKNSKPLFLVDMEGCDHSTPEQDLWLAVAQKALYEYCIFGDLYLHRKDKGVVLRELAVLTWFVFELKPQEFNLQWIAENTFTGDVDICTKIREKCKACHQVNLQKYAHDPTLGRILKELEGQRTAQSKPPHPDDIEIFNKARLKSRRRVC